MSEWVITVVVPLVVALIAGGPGLLMYMANRRKALAEARGFDADAVKALTEAYGLSSGSLVDVINVQRQELEELRQRVTRLDELERENKTLRSTVARLETENEELRSRVQELERHAREMDRRTNGDTGPLRAPGGG